MDSRLRTPYQLFVSGWRCLAVLLAVAVALAFAPVNAASQQAQSATAQLSVNAGRLLIVIGAPVLGSGGAEILSATVTDARGTGQGWHVNAAATKGQVDVTGVDVRVVAGVAPSRSANIAYPAKINPGQSPKAIFDALPRTGLGQFALTVHAVLHGRQSALALTLESGPAGSAPVVAGVALAGGSISGLATSSGSSLGLSVPAGALSDAANVVFQEVSQDAAAGVSSSSGGAFSLGSSAFTLSLVDSQGNELHSFEPPLTLTIRPGAADLQKAKGDLSKLGLAYFDTSATSWRPISCSVSGPDLVCSLSHLTLFAVTAPVPDSVGDVDSVSAEPVTESSSGSGSSGGAASQVPVITAGPVRVLIPSSGGTALGTFSGGQQVWVNVPADTASQLYSRAGATALSVVFDFQPSLTTASAVDVGGGDVTALAGPLDIKLQLADSGGNSLDLGPAASLPVTITLPAPSQLGQVGSSGDLAWLQAIYDHSGAFLGYVRPAAVFDPTSDTVVLTPAAGSLAGTLFLPVGIVPAWVQNFVPGIHIFSAPTPDGIDFGAAADHQFTTFTVVAPQVGRRLFVFNQATGNYGWIDVNGVGPSGPPR